MRSMIHAAIPALILLGAGSAAMAQPNQRDWAACDNLSGDGSPASVVAGCTAVIQDGKAAPASLASAYRSRGVAYRALGDNVHGITDFDQAIVLSPRDPGLFYSRGNAHAAQRDYVKAIADYDAAIRLDAEDARFFNNRGGAWHNQKDYARAIADFDKALTLDPDYPSALTNRCGSRAAQGQELEKAQADCDRSLRLRPQHSPTLDIRGLVGLLRRDFTAAFTDYDAAYKLDTSQPEALYGRGIAQLRLGRTEAGRADIAAASASDPSVPALFAQSGLTP